MTPRLLAALVLAATAIAGEASPLDQADTVLRIRDGRWVDREATRFAAAYGADLQGVRSELARVLYRSRSFDGIDLARQSLLAWRPGKAPLIAAIPITDRTAFLASFGAVDNDDAPLVRVGERDGTVVYTQNQPQGLWEYRLLVANNTAYVARNIDECRRLAAILGTAAEDPAAAPLQIDLRNQALLAPRLPGSDWLGALPALPVDAAELALVPGLVSGAWTDLAGQMSWMSVSARSGAQGDLLINLRVAARQDTILANWIAQQKPGTERLAGQMRGPTTALLMTGRLTFQGQLERWAFNQVDALKAAAGSRWSDGSDTAFRGLCTLAERCGAWAFEVERPAEGGILQQWVVEHPRTVEVAQSAAEVAGALAGKRAEPVRIGDLTAFTVESAPGPSLFLAGERHAVRIDDRGARRAAAVAPDLIKRLNEPSPLDAAPSLATLFLDLGQAWKAPPPPEGERNDPVVVSGLLRPAGPGQLELACSIPIQRMAAMLARLRKPQRSDE